MQLLAPTTRGHQHMMLPSAIQAVTASINCRMHSCHQMSNIPKYAPDTDTMGYGPVACQYVFGSNILQRTM